MAASIPILYSDEHLLVVDKPSGLLSVPARKGGRALPGVLAEQLGATPLAVHRLDREVSGAIVLALDPGTRDAMDALFRERRVEKTYWALLRGPPPKAEGDLKDPILEERGHARVSARGKSAHTRFRTLREHARATEVEVDLVTGRHNQIRVHFAHAGAPLVGETKYARRREDPFGFGRVALHAWRLAFEHPSSGARVELEAPLPADLEDLRVRAAAGRAP